MKSFIAVLILVLTIGSVVITVVYNTSVNSTIRFVPRTSHEEYINTRRSYRPRVQKPLPTAQPVPEVTLPDDDTAEEVTP